MFKLLFGLIGAGFVLAGIVALVAYGVEEFPKITLGVICGIPVTFVICKVVERGAFGEFFGILFVIAVGSVIIFSVEKFLEGK